MTFEEYRQYDATALAALVRQKEVSPAELLEVAIRRAEQLNPAIHAIVHKLYDLGRSMAEHTDVHAPFAGVPFLIKDLGIEVKDTPFSQGCAAYRSYVSEEDSEMVSRLRKAGLVFFGKTNTPEFGLSPYTEPKAFGPTRNPWNTAKTPGGSSGGSGAAVAAGIVPFATASDGGGSIRIPASCNGLFGLKPSRGRISLGPQVGEAWQGATMEHCVSRSVRDSAALLDLLQGNVAGDPYHLKPPSRTYLSELDEEPQKLRIDFSTRHCLDHEVDPECITAVKEAAGLLESLGHEVEEAALPLFREDLTEAFIYIIIGETSATLAEIEAYQGRPIRDGDVEPSTRALGLLGRHVSARDFARAARRWNLVRRRMPAFHRKYDLLLTPTVAMRPFDIGTLQPNAAENRLLWLVNTFGLGALAKRKINELAEKVFSYIPYTPLANMTGAPSMSVPLHMTTEQLPIGVMFTAPSGREDMLYRLAGQLEKAKPWFDNVPSL